MFREFRVWREKYCVIQQTQIIVFMVHLVKDVDKCRI